MILASLITPLEHAARHVLDWLGPHGAIGLPWAWSIAALTLIVRILLVPLTVKQIHSMQNLQRFAPQMKEIQQKYKTDKAKQNEELMRFYREHKINPAASCLPLVAQIPVFISLYFALNTFSKEAAKATSAISHDNLHWLGLIKITEPATKGWGPLLIVIYVISQLSSSYFMSTTVDKNQRILLMVLPVLFVPFIINFKTGLVLYWVTTNLWTVGQGLVTRRLMPKTPVAMGPKRSSRTPPRDEPPADGAKQSTPSSKPSAQAPAAPRRVKRKKKRARR